MMDVRYADEIRDDLLLSMGWMDECRQGLGDELETEFYSAVSFESDRFRLLLITLDTGRADFVVSRLSCTTVLNLTRSL